jgi:hypothetical protein
MNNQTCPTCGVWLEVCRCPEITDEMNDARISRTISSPPPLKPGAIDTASGAQTDTVNSATPEAPRGGEVHFSGQPKAPESMPASPDCMSGNLPVVPSQSSEVGCAPGDAEGSVLPGPSGTRWAHGQAEDAEALRRIALQVDAVRMRMARRQRVRHGRYGN